jgi:hypothetical protein
MKAVAAVLVVLFAGCVAFAQKTPEMQKAVRGSRANRSAYKSTNSDVVAAALKRNSSTASQLAQIERQNRSQSGRTSTHTSATLPKAYVAAPGKNKPIKLSYKAPKAAGKAH